MFNGRIISQGEQRDEHLEEHYEQRIDDVEKLLQKWGLPELKSKFRDHEITIHSLQFLTKEDISELIPKIGPRAIFRARLFEWQRTTANSQISSYPASLPSRSSTNYSYSMPSSIVKVESGYEDDIMEISSNENFQEITSNSFTSSDQSPPISMEDKISINKPKTLATLNDPDSEATIGDRTQTSPFLNFDIRSAIMNNYEGRQAIQYYKANGKLDYASRKKIVSIVIGIAISRNVGMCSNEFKRIAKEIIQLFPNESYFTYYIPREGSQNPRGALYNKFLNLSRKLRQEGLLQYRRNPSPNSSLPPSFNLRSTRCIKNYNN